MPFTLKSPATSELVIRKSRFLGRVQPVAGRAAALAVVARLRQEHPDAAHVCWALLAGGQSIIDTVAAASEHNPQVAVPVDEGMR